MLGFLLYTLVFPVISSPMENVFPEIIHCYYRELTGKPCPFCGLTQDMSCTLSGEANHQPANKHFQLFLTVYIVEWAVRILFTLASLKLQVKNLPAIDIAFHLVLAAVVVCFV